MKKKELKKRIYSMQQQATKWKLKADNLKNKVEKMQKELKEALNIIDAF